MYGPARICPRDVITDTCLKPAVSSTNGGTTLIPYHAPARVKRKNSATVSLSHGLNSSPCTVETTSPESFAIQVCRIATFHYLNDNIIAK
jgi:hypothetical protein